jgi:CRISPR-associated protein Cas1
MRYELVDGYGSQVLKHSERLILRFPQLAGEKTKRELPVLLLDHLLVGSKGVNVSTDAIALCCERGIPITVVDWRGRPLGRFASPALHGTAAVRRAQFAAFASRRGAYFAKAIVEGKLLNQADNLRYFAKNRKTRAPGEHTALNAVADCLQTLSVEAANVPGTNADEVRQELMVIEAEGAKGYWAAIQGIYGGKTGFMRREQRGTKDPLNAALNYAYGVLQADVWTAVTLVGLEPYAGMLHVDRPGRLSFVLDLMEEFRPVIADRVVFALAAKGWRIGQEENGWLDRATKGKLLAALGQRMEKSIEHEGRRVKLRNLIQLQARDAARHFLGKFNYEPIRQRW